MLASPPASVASPHSWPSRLQASREEGRSWREFRRRIVQSGRIDSSTYPQCRLITSPRFREDSPPPISIRVHSEGDAQPFHSTFNLRRANLPIYSRYHRFSSTCSVLARSFHSAANSVPRILSRGGFIVGQNTIVLHISGEIMEEQVNFRNVVYYTFAVGAHADANLPQVPELRTSASPRADLLKRCMFDTRFSPRMHSAAIIVCLELVRCCCLFACRAV